MADQIKIQLSQRPWEPTEDAQIVATFLAYDFPRIGIIEQEGNKYLFACLDEFRDMSLWAYALIEVGDIDWLRSDVRHVEEYFDKTNKSITLTLTMGERGIIHSASFFPHAGRDFLGSALESMREALNAVVAEVDAGIAAVG